MSDTNVNNGWYNSQKWETSDPRQRRGGDNPRFSTDYHLRMPGTPRLQRGYMRSAIPEKYGGQKLYFQFNPEAIFRSMTMTTGEAAPELQSPEQLEYPSWAAGQFAFNLVFDRSEEVGSTFQSVYQAGDLNSGDTSGQGVNVDIATLDTILGIKTSSTYAGLAQMNGSEAVGPNPVNQSSSAVVGVGVQMPSFNRPIRVIFSQAIMVEGIVGGCDVTFVRFNSAMVPTTAKVQISMNIFYFGAARMASIMAGWNGDFSENASPVSTVLDQLGLGALLNDSADEPTYAQAPGGYAQSNTNVDKSGAERDRPVNINGTSGFY